MNITILKGVMSSNVDIKFLVLRNICTQLCKDVQSTLDLILEYYIGKLQGYIRKLVVSIRNNIAGIDIYANSAHQIDCLMPRPLHVKISPLYRFR